MTTATTTTTTTLLLLQKLLRLRRRRRLLLLLGVALLIDWLGSLCAQAQVRPKSVSYCVSRHFVGALGSKLGKRLVG